jgi:hypothetical protein
MAHATQLEDQCAQLRLIESEHSALKTKLSSVQTALDDLTQRCGEDKMSPDSVFISQEGFFACCSLLARVRTAGLPSPARAS